MGRQVRPGFTGLLLAGPQGSPRRCSRKPAHTLSCQTTPDDLPVRLLAPGRQVYRAGLSHSVTSLPCSGKMPFTDI